MVVERKEKNGGNLRFSYVQISIVTEQAQEIENVLLCLSDWVSDWLF